MKIAVYGTLRKGWGNNRLLQQCEFIGSGHTKEKYQMTASGIPFVHPDKKVSKIKVEIYNVEGKDLERVDSLEGYSPEDHDRSWYKRTPIQVVMDNGEEIEASIYFNQQEASTIVPTGDYSDYSRTIIKATPLI
jgi:gamma-glutamylcyclotransferase (GGCT)/AIG2-like uncharacterized protein YtfP